MNPVWFIKREFLKAQLFRFHVEFRSFSRLIFGQSTVHLLFIIWWRWPLGKAEISIRFVKILLNFGLKMRGNIQKRKIKREEKKSLFFPFKKMKKSARYSER